MRKILYILPLLFLIVLSYRIHSQSPTWLIFTTSIPLFTTQLVYQFNITQPTNLTFITFTVPEQVLQQQLYYCKTYDPFVTNNVSLLQCAFAYPTDIVVYDSNLGVVGYEISYYTKVLSYDNTTGLPQTFAVLVQHHIGTLSPGTYYLYVYYPSPYYFSYGSMSNFSYIPSCPSNLSNITPSDFDGGWCGGGSGYQPDNNPIYGSPPLPVSYYPDGYYFPPSPALYYSVCPNVLGYVVYLSRYLYVKFNPQYPVMISYYIFGCAYDGCLYYTSVVVENPSTGQTQTVTLPKYGFNYGLYDLRELELQNGLDPNQYNEIVSVIQYIENTPPYPGCGDVFPDGFYLQYIPET